MSRKRKSDDVEWFLPGKKRRFVTSTPATSELIKFLAEDRTWREVHEAINYDPDAKSIAAMGDPDARDRSACKGCRAPNIGGFSYGTCPTRRALAAAEQPEPTPEQP